ncbi:MAG: endolytic transglycosylase MltG [Saprospiraceae bacterium]|nr:endolytic transglycosylase MltG [Saprospiraceae bacterium]
MRKKYWILLSVFCGIVLLICFLIYQGVFLDNVNPETKTNELYIRQGYSVNQVIDSLAEKKILITKANLANICKILGYNDQTVKEGRYLFKAGMNNYSIVKKLRSGNQDAIKVTINNVRNIQQMCSKLSEYLLLDSTKTFEMLSDSNYLAQLGYNRDNIMTLFIPNTYEMYWNIKFEKFIQRMQSENNKFWSQNERNIKAKEQHLTEKQVYILASIVEKETNYEAERPIIAGVYLNRLNQNMKLQADPTVVFALGVTGLRRVLLAHLAYESPYNTYMVEGLPPGPIYMPSINSIDAVLNPEKHDYLFFCAKEGQDGSHSFASTLKQHSENARKYQKWLNGLK